MAFMNRGDFSSVGGSDDVDTDGNHRRMYYRDYYRTCYYISLDNTYVIFEMIAAIVIFTIIGITFLAIYKAPVIDPIEDIKITFKNTYLVVSLFLIIIILFVNFFSRDKNLLIKRLLIMLGISILSILVFMCIKINMDSTYNNKYFEEVFIQEYGEVDSDEKSRFNINLTGVQLKTEKEYFVDECVKAYNIFSARMYGIFGANLILIVLLIYQIIRIINIQDKKDKLDKNDEILFDESQDVRY